MNRRLIFFSAAAAVLICAGCGSRNTPNPVQTASGPPASVDPAPGSSTGNFQPYTLIPQPAPKPSVIVKKHYVLRVVRQGKTVYLADNAGRSFLAGRDKQGHLYPVYRSPETHQDYPIYYDQDRDRYYREAQADNGRYYRNYVGDPSNRYYQSDTSQPYPDYQPEIVNSDGSIYDNGGYDGNGADYASNGNYESGGYYNGSAPPEHHRNNHRDDWLWAIPVVVGAYFLLNQHHHDSSPNYPNDQSPGIATQYSGSGNFAPGSFPPYARNPGVRQPFPATTNPGQAGIPPIGNPQPFPSAPGSQQPVFPSTPVRPIAAVRLPVHAASPTPNVVPGRQADSVPTRRLHEPTARPVVRVLPPVMGRPVSIRSVRISPVTRPAVPARRFPSHTVRPSVTMPRAYAPARPLAHRARIAVVRTRPGPSRRIALPYRTAVRHPAPASSRSFPVSPRSKARFVSAPRRPRPVIRSPAPRAVFHPARSRPIPAPKKPSPVRRRTPSVRNPSALKNHK